mgnify:FL=1
MTRAARLADRDGIRDLPNDGALDPGELLKGEGALELEIGFGKGRYLLRRAAAEPRHRFCGIEIASEYFRLAARRLAHRRLTNLLLLEGDASYYATALLPRGRFAAVHVYFPDPWPKLRHQKRRLFSTEAIDLVAGLVAPGGRLWFATDFLEYGAHVRRILESYPGARVAALDAVWPDGARTNYEAKYIAEGRPIVRLEVEFEAAAALHPEGAADVLVAARPDASGAG